MAAALSASDLPVTDPEEEPIDVLDLPQLYTKPSPYALLNALSLIKLEPLSWQLTSAGTPSYSASRTPTKAKRKVRNDGVPQYLTNIVSSNLAWMPDEAEKEQIWELASVRLSERAGRTGMGAISRTFSIPINTPSKDDKDDAERANATLEIIIHEPALTSDSLGLKTWASSYLLASRLHLLKSTLLAHFRLPPAILELGAGTGLVGLAAAAVFKTAVIATDLPEIVPNLHRNIIANAHMLQKYNGRAQAAILDWSVLDDLVTVTHPGSALSARFRLILAADPLYSPEHPRLLVDAVSTHLSRSGDARFVLELPLREAFQAERDDFRTRVLGVGLEAVAEGEEVGYDDWSEANARGDELAEVRCWWSVWRWRTDGYGWTALEDEDH